MVITAALVVERPIGREELARLLEARLLPHRRFRQKVVESSAWSAPRWVDVPAFDLSKHCAFRVVGGGDLSLERAVGESMSVPLERDRPLWRVDVVDGLERGSVLIFCVHHVLADGEALVAILGGLTDEGAHTELEPAPPVATGPAGRARGLLGGVVAAVRFALRATDPRALRRGLGTAKLVAFSRAMPLNELASRAHASGVTVTETLLAAVTGALRDRLAAAGGRRQPAVHALVPVSVRAGATSAAGNRFASVLVALPIAAIDPGRRLRLVADGLRAARSRAVVGAGVRLVGTAGLVSGAIERMGVSLFSRKASVVVSSVRGPDEAVHLGGALLRDVIVWAPAPGSIGLAVTLMSYAGDVRIGVSADARAIGDPRPIVRAIERELGARGNRA